MSIGAKTICDRCSKEVNARGIWQHQRNNPACRAIAKAEDSTGGFMCTEEAWNSANEHQEGAGDDYWAG